MKKILVAAALSLAIILGAWFGLGASAAWSGVIAPGELRHVFGELHQSHHIVLATAALTAVEPALFKIEDVCKILAIRPTTVYTLIARGELDAVKIGNKTPGARGTRITAASVQRLLEAAPKAEIKGKYVTLKTRRRLAREQGVSRA